MAGKEEQVEEWEVTIEGKKCYYALGSRDLLFIVSSESLQGPDIVPRRDVELTKEDLEELKKLDLPPEFKNWDDDASIMLARQGMDPNYNTKRVLVGVIRNDSRDKLSRKFVMRRVEELMKSTDKDGVIVFYYGPGKRSTGDWCFEDGYITFRDLAQLYCNCFKGRVLTIYTDCSFSGSWVKELMKFLDEQGVRPCGHSAREKGILIKVRASCQTTEIPHRLLYSVRANVNDKRNKMVLIQPSGFEVAKDQHIYRIDSTWLSCSASSFEEPCTLSPEFTWERKEAVEQHRIFVLRGADSGRPAWHYVIVDDDEAKIKEFKELTQGENAGKHTVNIPKYGKVIKSGWGRDPPDDAKKWLKNNYGGDDL